jgi:hypothetical protein
LIVNEVDTLKAAYGLVASNLNVTSMCVYSGPGDLHDTRGYRRLIPRYGEHCLACCNVTGGWLGTGDAALKEKLRLDPFLKHYGSLLDRVATLTMPHHGSDGNFHPDLLDGVNPTYCVTAAAKFKDWRHPGTSVVQSVASRGIPLLVATADDRSAIDERFYIG